MTTEAGFGLGFGEMRSALNAALDEITALRGENDRLRGNLAKAKAEVASLRAEMDGPMLGGER